MVCSLAVPCQLNLHQLATHCGRRSFYHFLNNTMSANLNDMAMPNTAGNRSDTMWWTLKTKYLLACDTERCRDDNSYSLPVISKLLICRCLVPSDLIGIIRNMVINYSVLSGRLHSGYSGCHNSSFTMTVNSLFLSYGIGERKWSALDASFE